MKVGVLVCDHIDPDLRETAGGDLDDVFTDLLRRADPDVEVRVYDVIGGEMPVSTSECGGWLITGSRHGVDLGEPWVEDLKVFIRELHAERSRLVGVCFGHQMIADALGGETARAAAWKVAPQKMVVEQQPWFDGGEVALHAMHRDVVTVLPDGAVPIASGETGTYPAFRVGDHILTVQDHPEFNRGIVRRLMERRAELIGEDAVADGLGRLDLPTDNDVVGRWFVDFLADVRTS